MPVVRLKSSGLVMLLLLAGCQLSSAPPPTSGGRVNDAAWLEGYTEDDLLRFANQHAPPGTAMDDAIEELTKRGFTCTFFASSEGSREMYCSQSRKVDSFVTMIYVLRAEVEDGTIRSWKSEINGMGP